jgi:hypothetical protein
VKGLFVRDRRTRRPRIELDDMHGQLLTNLCGQMIELISPEEDPGADPLAAELGLSGLGSTTPLHTPDDPALARLLPDAYRDDPIASSEYRRYTENDLRLRKRDHARAVLEGVDKAAGGPIVLDEQQAAAWLGALNDLRLALGARLEVTEDLERYVEGLDPEDPRLAMLAVYHWLGAVQDSLIETL